MPIVDVKGVGKAQFPDEMPINDIRSFLQNKFSQRAINGQSDTLQPVENIAAPYEPTLTEKIGSGISNALTDSGIISNQFGANQIGSTIAGIGEFLPGVGDATAGDEFGRAVAKGDKLGMAMAGLGVIPVAGDLAKKGGRKMERLFHASPVEFDAFDPSRVGDRMTSLGLGHYLTPSKSKANQYGENLMEFDVDTTDIFDWKNPTTSQRDEIEKNLLEIIPEERISHFGSNKIESVPRNKEGLARLEELQEQTKDAYNDYAKARILTDDEIEKSIPNFDFKNNDDVVIGWRESGNLKGANNEQLMTLMNEYSPNLVKNLGYKGARFGDEVALFDAKLATKVNKNAIKPVTNSMDEVKKVTSYNDMFDFTPEQMAQQLRSSKPDNVVDGVYIEQTKFGEKRFNPDGSVEIVKGGEVLRRIEPQDADMAYKNKIMKNESEKPEVKAAQEKRKAEFDAEIIKQRAQAEEGYKMQHTAPTREDNPSGDDLTDTFGTDIYTGNALQYFGTGSSYDNKAIKIIQGMKGKPNKLVTIYRAVPNNVKEINSSDWVTTTKEYAQDHMEGEEGWHILSKKVKAKDIATDGNSIHEFGYDPEVN